MARATRSSATHVQSDKDLPKSKSSTKKRKRSDNDDTHTPKQPRAIKDEIDDDILQLKNLQLAGNVPIDTNDAQHILDILAR